jgi:hypothetical protein
MGVFVASLETGEHLLRKVGRDKRKDCWTPQNWLECRSWRSSAIGWEKSGGSWGPVLGTLEGVEAEVEYTALVSVKVNLGTGEVASVDIRAPGDGDDVPAEVGVSLDSETDQPDEVFYLAQ